MSDPENSPVLPDVATDTAVREQAYHLVYEQYLAKGYTRAKDSGLWLTLYDGLEDTTTLIIERDNEVVRTLTLVPDGPMGLPADELFQDHLDNLRLSCRLGEVSSFAANPALDDSIESAVVLLNAGALLCARHGLTHLVITVHPRHVSFYKRCLRFEPLGEVRSYDKVDGAPARLLVLDLRLPNRTMRGDLSVRGSLYPRFWGPADSRRIAGKLVESHRPMSVEQLRHFFVVRTPLWYKASAEWQSALLHGRAPTEVMQATPGEPVAAPRPPLEGRGEPTLLDRKTFAHLVEAAVRAPSPNNLQPWAFAQYGDDLEVYYDRTRALASDVQDRFALLALGAAIESIVLEAGARGMTGAFELDEARPRTEGQRERIGRVRLGDHGAPDPLVRQLARRRTDRRPYATTPLSEYEATTLSEAPVGSTTGFELTRDRQAIDQVAGTVAVADRIRLETPILYDELRASLQSDPEAKTGLDVRRLGLPLAGGFALSLMGPWSRARVLNSLGASLLAGSFARYQVRHSGALGLLTATEPTDLAVITAGRDLLRIWLAAHAMGLSVQPLGALPLLRARAEHHGAAFLSAAHHAQLVNAGKKFDEVFPLTSSDGGDPSSSEEPDASAPPRATALLLLRFGHASGPPDDPLSARLPEADVVVKGEPDE